jgi:uncharacterized membrane protein
MTMLSARRTGSGWWRAAVASIVLVALSLAQSGPVAADQRPHPGDDVPAQPAAQGYAMGGQGYLLDRGRFTPVAVPGATGTLPFDVNDRGQIVGAYDDPQGRTHGFLLDRGRYRTIDAPGSTGTHATGVSGSAAFGMNNRGQIVGAYVGADNRIHGYVLDRGRFQTIDAPGTSDTVVFGINDRGQMTVQSSSPDGPFFDLLLDDGEFTPLVPPGAVGSRAHKIDARGQVVGVFSGSDGVQRGFTFRNGRYRTIDFEGADATGVNASNARGQIVGYFVTGDLSQPTAVVRGAILDRGRLTTFEAPGPPTGPSGTTAYDINERGQIVGAKSPIADPAAASPPTTGMAPVDPGPGPSEMPRGSTNPGPGPRS